MENAKGKEESIRKLYILNPSASLRVKNPVAELEIEILPARLKVQRWQALRSELRTKEP
jgi:hypothetical protein